jgi:integrase
MAKVIERLKVEDATPHGFRSSFRDWAGNETAFPREIAEAALAHTIGDAVERAYRRSDALERRRELMEAWGRYCGPAAGGNVVKLRAGGGTA